MRITRFLACSALIHAACAVILWRTSKEKIVAAPEPTFVEVEVEAPTEGTGEAATQGSGAGVSAGQRPGRGRGQGGSRGAAATSPAASAATPKLDFRFSHEVDIPVTQNEGGAPAKRGLFQRPLDLHLSPFGEVPPLPEKPRQLAANPGGSTYHDPSERFDARVARDGRVEIRDQKTRWEGLGFGFDVNDMIDRARGKETYLPEKRLLLEESFERRAILSNSARRDRLEEALTELPARLDALWNDARRSVRERRRLLFELWDEIDVADPACAPARARIEDFIRHRLPRGSLDAYPAAELAALNQGRSDRFEPYR